MQVEVWGTGPDAEAFALIRSVDFFFSFKIDAITGAVTVNDFNIYNIGLVTENKFMHEEFLKGLYVLFADKSMLKLTDWLRSTGLSNPSLNLLLKPSKTILPRPYLLLSWSYSVK